MPMTVESIITSSITKYSTTKDKNGVIKARLVTLATVEE
jgi:hypothetical protein